MARLNWKSDLFPLLMKTGSGIIILLIVWIIISNLPMLEAIPFPAAFALPHLLGALVLTGLIALLLHAGNTLKSRLEYASANFPDAGRLTRQAVVLI